MSLLALVGLQDLLHVELHERELLLEPRPRLLARLDLRLDGLAVDLVRACIAWS